MSTSAITSFARWCATERGAPVGEDYWSLWTWSVGDLPGFWAAVWDYFEIDSPTGYERPLAEEHMPGARWFPGARVNYVRQVLRAARTDRPAVIDVAEPGTRPTRTVSWDELRRQVGAHAATLLDLGVQPGDRVVGYLPNTVEAVVAFLATASIGAVWSSCGQDYARDRDPVGRRHHLPLGRDWCARPAGGRGPRPGRRPPDATQRPHLRPRAIAVPSSPRRLTVSAIHATTADATPRPVRTQFQRYQVVSSAGTASGGKPGSSIPRFVGTK